MQSALARPLISVGIAATLVFSASGCGLEDEADESLPQLIVDGAPSPFDPAVVAVLPRRSGCEQPAEAFCTGVLIAPSVVLTAAHCLLAFNQPGGYEVFFGFDTSDPSSGRFVIGAEVATHPEYDRDTDANDLGLIRLASPMTGVRPVTVFDGDLEAALTESSTLIRAVGFGRTDRDIDPDGMRRSGTMGVELVSEDTIVSSPAPGMTCVGDSGGPVFLDVDGQEQLIAITARGDFQCDQEAVNQRLDAAWESFIGPFVDEAALATSTAPPSSEELAGLCEASCQTPSDCPANLTCTATFGAPVCSLPAREPARFDDVCASDSECGSGLCAQIYPGEACRCLNPCFNIQPPEPEPDVGTSADADVDGELVGGAGCSLKAGRRYPPNPLYLLIALAISRRSRSRDTRPSSAGDQG